MMARSIPNNKILQNSQDNSNLAQHANDIKCSGHNKNVVTELNSETKRQRNY